MSITVDLNADLAEIDSPTNTAMLAHLSSANIACGVHAGDPLLMHRTIGKARMLDVAVGAHPSYPDRENFGRKSMFVGAKPKMTEPELHAVIRTQLATFASLNDGEIAYVKPHGALYNDAQVNSTVAHVIADEAERYGAAIMGQPGSKMQQVTEARGLIYIAEVFADRGYNHNGTLIGRGLPKSEHTNPVFIAQRVVRMVTERTVTTWGRDFDTRENVEKTYTFPTVDSVCLHGDTRGAYDIARAVRTALTKAGVSIASPLAVTR